MGWGSRYIYVNTLSQVVGSSFSCSQSFYFIFGPTNDLPYILGKKKKKKLLSMKDLKEWNIWKSPENVLQC